VKTVRLIHQVPPRCNSMYLIPGGVLISCRLAEGHEGLHRDEGYRWIVEKASKEGQ
jgi:hypothetical protein